MKLLILTLSLLLPVSGHASIAQCDRLTMAHHAGERSHFDLGYGGVAYQSFTSILGGSTGSLNVVSCSTGKTIRIPLYSSTAKQDANAESAVIRDFDVSERVLAQFEQMVVSDQTYTFDQLANEMRKLSPSVIEVKNASEQPCGCAVAYPDYGKYDKPFDLGTLE